MHYDPGLTTSWTWDIWFNSSHSFYYTAYRPADVYAFAAGNQTPGVPVAGFQAYDKANSDIFITSSAYTTPITLKIAVGWGEVDTLKLASGNIGQTVVFLRSGYRYSDIVGYLHTAAVCPGIRHAAHSAFRSIPGIE